MTFFGVLSQTSAASDDRQVLKRKGRFASSWVTMAWSTSEMEEGGRSRRLAELDAEVIAASVEVIETL